MEDNSSNFRLIEDFPDDIQEKTDLALKILQNAMDLLERLEIDWIVASQSLAVIQAIHLYDKCDPIHWESCIQDIDILLRRNLNNFSNPPEEESQEESNN